MRYDFVAVTMITGRNRFNLYLLILLAGLSACGCRTSQKDPKAKLLSTIRVHLGATASDAERSVKAEIYREHPFSVTLQRDPFLTEAHIAAAKIMEVPGGGFDLQIQFNQQGTWLLQQYSAANPGKHYAIFSQFGEKGKKSRWLAAPAFTHLISNGTIQFAPDTSREEAEDIVRGLSNLAKKVEKKDKW
jgi:preprotein translocase subunit SecD